MPWQSPFFFVLLPSGCCVNSAPPGTGFIYCPGFFHLIWGFTLPQVHRKRNQRKQSSPLPCRFRWRTSPHMCLQIRLRFQSPGSLRPDRKPAQKLRRRRPSHKRYSSVPPLSAPTAPCPNSIPFHCRFPSGKAFCATEIGRAHV